MGFYNCSPDDLESYQDVCDSYITNYDKVDIHMATHYLEGVMDAIYDMGDIGLLEHCLENLCAVLKVNFDGKPPKIKTTEK